jgi:hypothetical protein
MKQGLPINFIVLAALAILILILAAGFVITGGTSMSISNLTLQQQGLVDNLNVIYTDGNFSNGEKVCVQNETVRHCELSMPYAIRIACPGNETVCFAMMGYPFSVDVCKQPPCDHYINEIQCPNSIVEKSLLYDTCFASNHPVSENWQIISTDHLQEERTDFCISHFITINCIEWQLEWS